MLLADSLFKFYSISCGIAVKAIFYSTLAGDVRTLLKGFSSHYPDILTSSPQSA